MWNFIKQIFAVIIGLAIFCFLGFIFLIGIAAGLSNTKEVVVVADNSVLQLKLDKKILERESDNPLEDLGIPTNRTSGLGLLEIKQAIKYAKNDPKIKGIFINSESVNAGLATVEEIRNALLDFKESKKFIYAYGEAYSEAGYYLASVADKIYLNPVGLLEFNGYSSRFLYVKGTLEKLEVKPEVFKVGDYKSAIEPLISDKMSDYNREQTMSFLSSMNNHMLRNIAVARNMPVERLKTISDSMLVHNAEDALKYKIVTNLGYYDEVLSAMKKSLKIEQKDRINFISYGKYKNSIKEGEKISDNVVAVIVAQGDIGRGKSDDGSIGSDDMAEEIRKARLDEKIKAVVLRINSPGGDALASDVMWREVVLTSKVKPIVASMSDVAASGGYYMAMGCDKIVAQPNSITGSIGVFGVLFNIRDFLKNKLGITTDGVKTGLFSDVGNPTRELTAYERKAIQQEVDGIYKDFVTKAAQGRKMEVEELKKYASGRVWSGIEAKDRGLVDELGGIDKAVEVATGLAHIEEDYKISYFPQKKSFFEKIMEDFQNDSKIKALKAELGPYYNVYNQVKNIKKLEGIQARLPFEMIIE